MQRLASLAVAMLLSAISLCATDLTITFQVETRSLLGGKTNSEVHYYTPRYHMVRNPSAETDSLVDFQEGKTYTIDHQEKKISMVRLEDALAALEAMSRKGAEGVGRLAASAIGDPDEYTVETEGTEKVAGRPCTIHKIQVARLHMLMSVDPTLTLPVSPEDYARMLKARAAGLAQAGPVAAAFKRLHEEMGRVRGVPLKMEMSGYGGVTHARHEATEIKQGPVAASTFALPAYPIEDMGRKLLEEAK